MVRKLCRICAQLNQEAEEWAKSLSQRLCWPGQNGVTTCHSDPINRRHTGENIFYHWTGDRDFFPKVSTFTQKNYCNSNQFHCRQIWQNSVLINGIAKKTFGITLRVNVRYPKNATKESMEKRTKSTVDAGTLPSSSGRLARSWAWGWFKSKLETKSTAGWWHAMSHQEMLVSWAGTWETSPWHFRKAIATSLKKRSSQQKMTKAVEWILDGTLSVAWFFGV